MTSNRMLLGTQKGLLTLEYRRNGWDMIREDFLGEPVPYAATDPRTGDVWAALDHGHWGVKLNRSKDAGASWQEVHAPAYPEGAEFADGEAATARYLWVIAPGHGDEPQRLYIGTEPGGLFVSSDGGTPG